MRVLPEPTDFARIAPGDSYRFACTRCGECCFDQTVRLEPHDMLALRDALACSTSALFANGTVRQVNGEVLLAQVPFTRGHTRCRFVAPVMRGDAVAHYDCELHAAGKPFVCGLAPIAVADDGLRLVPPVLGCPGMDQGPLRVLTLDDERHADSAFFHRALAPRMPALLRRAFDFDAFASVHTHAQLRAYLEALL